MPATCLVKVTKRNLGDTEADNLFQKVESDQRGPFRIILRDPTVNQLGEIPCEEKRGPRLDPNVDRCGGIPRDVVRHNQARQEVVSHLMGQVLQSPKKQV